MVAPWAHGLGTWGCSLGTWVAAWAHGAAAWAHGVAAWGQWGCGSETLRSVRTTSLASATCGPV